MTSPSPQKLIVAAVAMILMALFNAYLVRRAQKTGKIRSRMAIHERDRDRFSFYTTVYLHVILPLSRWYAPLSFCGRRRKLGRLAWTCREYNSTAIRTARPS
jgi:hypothetical protein